MTLVRTRYVPLEIDRWIPAVASYQVVVGIRTVIPVPEDDTLAYPGTSASMIL